MAMNVMQLFNTKTNQHKVIVFLITGVLFACLHACRTAWAYTKPSIHNEFHYDDAILSWFDCSFLTMYAIGLYLTGWLGDRVDVKSVVVKGMMINIAGMVVFAVLEGFFKVKYVFVGLLLFGINGLSQSTAFPNFLTILTNWFPSEQRGFVFGAWLTNAHLGNILGQQIGRAIIDIAHLNWAYVMLVCSALVALMTIIIFKYLHTSPSEAGLNRRVKPQSKPETLNRPETEIDNEEPDSGEPVQIVSSVDTLEEQSFEARAIGFLEAWKQPGVLFYAIVFACIRSANLALLFGLPTYLKLEVGFKKETAELLACYEFGQIIGVIALGYISDRLPKKCKVISSSLLGAVVIFSMISFIKSPQYFYIYAMLLFLGGMLLAGPSSLLAGAIASDLGENKADSHKVKSKSTIFGIIDGTGTIGAAALQPVIPYLRSYSFILYTALILLAAVLTPFASKQAHKHHPKVIPNETKLDTLDASNIFTIEDEQEDVV